MKRPRPPVAAPRLTTRCAIYTRKSTEEGLDQDFNTLDAQREAAEAYIASQRGEGWEVVPDHYDDGGFSGGNMDRPALQRLLADIETGRVNAVVVYKVDRLSRSLLDFSRIMEVLDQRKVAFVSVTQQFNTATSMGRLILHVLLSFAQFEREMIAERTRDKMSAARRKGKWTGGMPFLGYDVAPDGGKLLVNETEAKRVLAQVARSLERLSMTSPAERDVDGAVREIASSMDAQRRTGLSLDTFLSHEVPGPEETADTVPLQDLERCCLESVHLRERLVPLPGMEGAYRLGLPGEGADVTFRQELFDAHPQSLRLLTYGDAPAGGRPRQGVVGHAHHLRPADGPAVRHRRPARDRRRGRVVDDRRGGGGRGLRGRDGEGGEGGPGVRPRALPEGPGAARCGRRGRHPQGPPWRRRRRRRRKRRRWSGRGRRRSGAGRCRGPRHRRSRRPDRTRRRRATSRTRRAGS